MRRFASVQPRRCVLPTSARRIPEVGLSHTIGRSHDHGASVPASPLPMVSRPHSTSGGSGSRDVFLDPANAQFWGDSWGGRQQPQQTANC